MELTKRLEAISQHARRVPMVGGVMLNVNDACDVLDELRQVIPTAIIAQRKAAGMSDADEEASRPAMDRESYVAEVLRIQTQTSRFCRRFVRLGLLAPWQIEQTTRTVAQMMRFGVARLRLLRPPVEDRDAIERHLLSPLDARIEELEVAANLASADVRRLHWRRAFTRMTDALERAPDPVDEAWCTEYGLAPQA